MNEETKKIFREIEESTKSEGAKDLEKEELEELRRDRALRDNIEKELDLLVEIFPSIKAEDIPDEVLEESKDGKGLAAAFALWYLREEKKKEKAAEKNEQNTRSAPPEVAPPREESYYTPEAVKAMSENDIRKNYKAILRSMETWNK